MGRDMENHMDQGFNGLHNELALCCLNGECVFNGLIHESRGGVHAALVLSVSIAGRRRVS